MFRDIIHIKYALDDLYRRNFIKGFIKKKFYRFQLKKLLKRLNNQPVDIELLKAYYEFINLTNINQNDKFLSKYYISIESDNNTINIYVVDSELSFIISISQNRRLNITYNEDSKDLYIFELQGSLSVRDKRDKYKSIVTKKINDSIIDIIIFSVLLFYDERKK